MKTNELVIAAMALLSPTLGCGDDATPGGGADDSTGSTGVASSSSTTEAADDTGTTAGSGGMDGGSSSSSSGDPLEVTVEGEVIDFNPLNMVPIPGSEITVYETPGPMATSDAMGLFSIGPLMPDNDAIFVLAPNDEYWGAVIPVEIGSDPLQEDVELSQISNMVVEEQIAGLEEQMPAMPDLEQAIIVVRLRNYSAVAEGPTTIEMTPAPDPGTFYSPDAMGLPILDKNTIDFSILPVVVYFNVPETDPGTITFEATHPTRECTVLFPELPTIGRHMTLVEVECVAP